MYRLTFVTSSSPPLSQRMAIDRKELVAVVGEIRLFARAHLSIVFRPRYHERTLNYPLFIIALSRPSPPVRLGRKLFSPLIYSAGNEGGSFFFPSLPTHSHFDSPRAILM